MMRSKAQGLGFLVFLQAMLFAGNAGAYPLRSDEVALRVDAGEARSELDQVSPIPPVSSLPAEVSEETSPTIRLSADDALRLLAPPVSAPEDDVALARVLLSQARAGAQTTDAREAVAASVEPDPLAGALRSLVNVTRRQNAAKSSASAARPEPEDGVELGEEVRAGILEVKQALAEAVRTVLEPRMGDDGRVSFSLAGIDGFQVAADGSEFSVGYGGTTLGSVQYGAGQHAGEGGYPGAPNASRGSGHAAGVGERNPVRELIELVTEVVEHPLTWLLIALIAVGRVVASVAGTWGQKPHDFSVTAPILHRRIKGRRSLA